MPPEILIPHLFTRIFQRLFNILLNLWVVQNIFYLISPCLGDKFNPFLGIFLDLGNYIVVKYQPCRFFSSSDYPIFYPFPDLLLDSSLRDKKTTNNIMPQGTAITKCLTNNLPNPSSFIACPPFLAFRLIL